MHAPVLHAEPRRLSRDEYHRMGALGFFRGERVELIYGTVVRMAPIGPAHADPVDQLADIFMRTLADRARVRIQQPFVAVDESEPEPDVALVPARRYSDEHPREAYLIVEVAETSLDYDRDTKAPLYARSGVPEYWIVDVERRCVLVFDQPVEGVYVRSRSFESTATLRPARFPDVAVPVADLFP